MVYNEHNLIHTCGIKSHGAIDSISCFKFESKLGSLKKLVTKPNCILAQMINRLKEQEIVTKNVENLPKLKLSKPYKEGPITPFMDEYSQYKCLDVGDFRFDTSNRYKGVATAMRLG